MCTVAVVVFVVRPANFDRTYYNALFYFVTIVLAVLSLLRYRTCHLAISPDELYFYNGIIDVRHIPVSQIEHIEFNPQIRLRVFVRRQGNRTTLQRIPNIFSIEDLLEIIGRFEACGIECSYIERPGKDIWTDKGPRVSETDNRGDLNG
jgi:hypothetical protein